MKKLSRNEMKNVVGGKNILVCTCGNSYNTTVCAFSGDLQSAQCGALAFQYCAYRL